MSTCEGTGLEPTEKTGPDERDRYWGSCPSCGAWYILRTDSKLRVHQSRLRQPRPSAPGWTSPLGWTEPGAQRQAPRHPGAE